MGNASNKYETDGICRCYVDSKGTKNVCWTHWPFPIEGMSNRPLAIAGKVKVIPKAPLQGDLFGGAI